jgi:hypothetical protein
MFTRRQFIQAGIAGTIALGAAGALTGCAGRSDGGPLALKDAHRAVFIALAPAVLAGALPTDGAGVEAVRRLIGRIERSIAGLSASAQQELGELLALLTFAPARVLVAGVIPSWEDTRPEQAAEFLQRWRFSRFALLQSAYHALHDLILGAWYADPESWGPIGYPGPPEVF